MKLALVGGFLGSGKTTAIVTACQQLVKQNKRVAVITNDQGEQQVDTAFVKSFGIPAREVANGCFCCNYDQLDKHLVSLQNTEHPDIIFAESVGSCTDLVATIVKPLDKVRPELATTVSVFIDSELFLSFIEGRSSFLSDSVRYIYKKQLEEADVLVLNKSDLLKQQELKTVYDVITSEYPGKIILYQNSLNDLDISRWLGVVESFTEGTARKSLDLDYEVYGDGESRLAWLDKSVIIHTSRGDGVFVTRKIIGSVFDQIQANRFTIGHLKFLLEAEGWKEKVSFTTTSTSGDIRIADKETKSIKLLINARVQTDPNALEMLVDEVLARAEHIYDCTIVDENWSAFKPGYPRPTHRIF